MKVLKIDKKVEFPAPVLSKILSVPQSTQKFYHTPAKLDLALKMRKKGRKKIFCLHMPGAS